MCQVVSKYTCLWLKTPVLSQGGRVYPIPSSLVEQGSVFFLMQWKTAYTSCSSYRCPLVSSNNIHMMPLILFMLNLSTDNNFLAQFPDDDHINAIWVLTGGGTWSLTPRTPLPVSVRSTVSLPPLLPAGLPPQWKRGSLTPSCTLRRHSRPPLLNLILISYLPTRQLPIWSGLLTDHTVLITTSGSLPSLLFYHK